VASFKRGYPALVFIAALVCGVIVGATLPGAHACSPAIPPTFDIVDAQGDPSEVQKWEAFRDAEDVVVIDFDHVRVSDGQYSPQYFGFVLEPAQ
jgi:hypothetical protein